MEKIKFLKLGGNDEDGKNITVIEIDDEMYVIDVGVRYPQSSEVLGVEIIVPDFQYILENKRKLKAVFITHGHDDVMGALPYLLSEVNVPIYTTPLTALMIKDNLKENNIKNAKIVEIKRNDRFKIGKRNFVTFGLTHSIPDTFGLGIHTKQGYIIHSTEFVIDFDVRSESFACDVSNLAEIGKEGVFMLTMESINASKEGFTSPKHRIAEKIQTTFENTDKRIFTTLYDQNLYRLIEVIEMAIKFKRKIYFYDEETRRLMNYLERLNYYKMPKNLELTKNQFNNNIEDVVVIISKTGPDVFRTMHRIAMGESSEVTLRETDNVIIASPIVPGTEVVAGAMENELFKENVHINSLNYKEVYSMHGSKEDIKMMLYLMKPKYFIPVKGEYKDLVDNANIAFEMDYLAKNIIVLDNGEIASFNNGEYVESTDKIDLEEVLIDGKEHLDTTGLVLRDRRILATDGAIIAGMVIHHKTKEIIGGPDVQSRGVIYLKDAENIVSEVGNILEQTIKRFVKEKRYDNVSCRNEARDLISKYIFKTTGKRPMVLPVIIEVII